MRGHLAHGWCYPGKVAAALSSDADLAKWALAEIREDWNAWEAAVKAGGHCWGKPVLGSFFHWTIVRETFDLLAVANWKLTPAVVKQLRRVTSYMGGDMLRRNNFSTGFGPCW